MITIGTHEKTSTPDEYLQLNKDEQILALKIARNHLKNLLTKRKKIKIKNIPYTFKKKVSTVLVIWINGSAHQSESIHATPFIDGIYAAVQSIINKRTLHILDLRSVDEWRIEILLFSNQNLIKINKKRDILDYSKGYQAITGSEKNIILPFHFNTYQITTFQDLIEKINFIRSPYSKKYTHTALYSFNVFDFIESDSSGNPLIIRGPVAQLKNSKDKESGDNAASWLINNQSIGGNYTSVVVLDGKPHTNDEWERKTMSAWGLAEFGNATNNNEYILSAEKYFYFAKNIFVDNQNGKTRYLVLAYLGQLALTLHKDDEALLIAQKIQESITEVRFNEITYAQIASFFTVISVLDRKNNYLEIALQFTDRVFQKLENELQQKNKNSIYLAPYSELPNTYFLLYTRTNNPLCKLAAEKVLGWIIDHQTKSGSFPVNKTSGKNNTRLHAKILEILPHAHHLFSATTTIYKDAYDKGIDWIKNYQYTHENSYYVEKDSIKTILGGFRQNDSSKDVWIDTVGHLLLGMARTIHPQSLLLESKRTSSTNPFTIRPLLISPGLFKTFSQTTSDTYFYTINFFINYFVLKLLLSVFRAFALEIRYFTAITTPNTNNDKRLLHYLYTASALAKEKILLHKNLNNSFLYTFFENTPGFFRLNLTTTYNKNTDGKMSSVNYSHGFSKNWETAMMQSFGEVFERYFHSIYRNKNLLRSAIGDTSQIKKISLKHLVRFSENQILNFSNTKITEDTILAWDTVTRLSTKEKALAPAQLIYWNYLPSNEPRLRESNTSGLGGGFTEEQALLSALYEVIERDAYFLHWLSKVPPTRIDPTTINSTEFQQLYAESTKYGIEVIILMANIDTKVPVCFTILHDPSVHGPTYVLGGACKSDPIRAILRSFDEAWSIYFWSRLKYNGSYSSLPDTYKPFQVNIPIDERVSIWSNKKMLGQLDFFINTPMKDFNNIDFIYPKNFSSEKEELRHATETVEKLGEGFEVYAHIQHSKELKRANYHSVRIIVPGLIPMYYNEINAPLCNYRLQNFNTKNSIKENFINPLLHIFP